jgi:Ca-activated chloride channel homolog
MTALALSLLAMLSPLQEDRPVFRVSTEAVQVDVFVGEDRRAVPGLGLSDFELYEDGEPRKIDSVAVAEIPLNVLLVLDTSASVKGATFSHLHRAASGFLDELSPDDRAGLITFSHHLSLRSGLTSNVAPLKTSLQENEAAGGTAWHDALFGALEILESVRERPMVLLFTDGADTYSWLSEEQVKALAGRTNAVIYAITRDESAPMPLLGTMQAQERYRQERREHIARTGLLHEVTRETGGRLIETNSFDRLHEIFLEILAEMRTRYILTYTPEALVHGWHTLEVKVKRKGVDVHARRGYYYEARN